jgi:hypothetical protein
VPLDFSFQDHALLILLEVCYPALFPVGSRLDGKGKGHRDVGGLGVDSQARDCSRHIPPSVDGLTAALWWNLRIFACGFSLERKGNCQGSSEAEAWQGGDYRATKGLDYFTPV